ncbi:unnamed protein product [Linum tenue]|uniref:Uncharacterized protein n=1 Tax=Linum tenue TaxID=586396 RepID=A0AAV0IGU0_9ROSI|nr:unnamed protein product [Linum tenue]
MKHYGLRRRRVSLTSVLAVVVLFTATGLLLLTLRSVDPPPSSPGGFLPDLDGRRVETRVSGDDSNSLMSSPAIKQLETGNVTGAQSKSCATVEEMGESFEDEPWKESLRVKRIIRQHFLINGASRIRDLPPEEFCRHGFVLGKSSEAGFGNEMYKVLNSAALSILLNRSLIIGQTRGKYPFGDYIAYSNHSFTLNEVKHLWRQHGCVKNYGRHLVIRIDDFLKPAKTNVLCSNWRKWEQPIIWFQNTTDAMGSQFFLKNVYPEMRSAAYDLFGQPEQLQSRPNVFGELMAFLISPSAEVKEAVDVVLAGGPDPDISLHMRMLMNRPVRAVQAALNCVQKAMHNLQNKQRPRLVLVSDTPSFVKSLLPNISEFAEVLHFDYKKFQGTIPRDDKTVQKNLDFRVKDWGPAPRWVAFVDFFLAARARHAVISGAHRRVGTTYAQLVASLAAANQLGENHTNPSFSFLSSFQSNLLTNGLRMQVGWGHVWNRFAGPLSCENQTHQCAFTPLSPPAWWDGVWQSPMSRDVRRLSMYGVSVSGLGTVDESALKSHCASKKTTVRTVMLI